MLVVVIYLVAISEGCGASLFFDAILLAKCKYQEVSPLTERLVLIGRVCGFVFIGQCLVVTLLESMGCAVIKKDGTVTFCEDEEEDDTWDESYDTNPHQPAQKTQLFDEN